MKIERIKIDGDGEDQMIATLRLIGDAIRKGSHDLKIRNHAARLASTAAPKDYLGQAKAIYDSFTKHWRYVRDPVDRELLSYSPEALYKLVMGADGKGAGKGYGVGDCDCASAAIGAQLQAIGIPVRLATTADPRAPMGGTFGHVFVQAQIPHMGWITVDPVLFPTREFGATAPHARIAIWDLDGRFITARGNYIKKKKEKRSCSDNISQLIPIFKLTRAIMGF